MKFLRIEFLDKKQNSHLNTKNVVVFVISVILKLETKYENKTFKEPMIFKHFIKNYMVTFQ